ncbi:MAG: UDP-N-acetylglucosamine 2-epimerase (non-hydrolyzing) [bacterium]
MKKISVIFGTRPEAIKLAPVILELKKHPDLFQCHVSVTAQHRQMLDQVLEVFDFTPDTDLDLMEKEQTLAGFTSKALVALDQYLATEMPDMVVIQGDTTTVFCAALAAFYRQIPVAHVEAGLRTGNIYSPWPEEVNRILASRLTTLHFAPTEWSRQNLLREGVPDQKIFVTGNTVVDSLLLSLIRIEKKPPLLPGPIQELIDNNQRIVLITGHRRENFGQGFENICTAIARLAELFPDVHFVYPVHLNPSVQEPVHRILQNSLNHNIHLPSPIPYLPFIALMKHASVILTDSGGIQEEAPSLGKPVIVMRDTTERPEGVEAGVVTLVGTEVEKIVSEVSRCLTDTGYNAHCVRDPRSKIQDGDQMKGSPASCILHPASCINFFNPYGDGTASVKIVEILKNYFKV